jgi:hypothetical protein
MTGPQLDEKEKGSPLIEHRVPAYAGAARPGCARIAA